MSEDKTSDGKFPVGADAPSVLAEVTARQAREEVRRKDKSVKNQARKKWQKEGAFEVGEVTASERRNKLRYKGKTPPVNLPAVKITARMPRPSR